MKSAASSAQLGEQSDADVEHPGHEQLPRHRQALLIYTASDFHYSKSCFIWLPQWRLSTQIPSFLRVTSAQSPQFGEPNAPGVVCVSLIWCDNKVRRVLYLGGTVGLPQRNWIDEQNLYLHLSVIYLSIAAAMYIPSIYISICILLLPDTHICLYKYISLISVWLQLNFHSS